MDLSTNEVSAVTAYFWIIFLFTQDVGPGFSLITFLSAARLVSVYEITSRYAKFLPVSVVPI